MNKKKYKEIIDKFIVEKYDYLMECAKNICRGKKIEHGELVSELAIFLYEGQEKLQSYVDIDMLLGFSVSWLKLQSQYDSTTFNRKHFPMSKISEEIESVKEMPAEEGDSFDEDAYIKDLKSIYTDEQIEKILKIHDIYPNLDGINQTLFNAYFIEGLSMDKIKEKYSFFKEKNGTRKFYRSRQTIYYMVKELKNEIKRRL